jgi:hypothetical protein
MRKATQSLRRWIGTPAGRWSVTGFLLVTIVAAICGPIAYSALASKPGAHPRVAQRDPNAQTRWQQREQHTLFGNSHPSVEQLLAARQAVVKLPHSTLGSAVRPATTQAGANTTISGYSDNWTPLGPQPLAWLGGRVSGAVTAVVADSNGLWIGTRDGGVWRYTYLSGYWSPMTDNQPTMAISALARDTNSGALYAGTGGSLVYPGIGLLKSVDNGATWTNVGYGAFAALTVKRIAIDPATGALLLAARNDSFATHLGGPGSPRLNAGIWRSVDGGVTWTQTLHDPLAVSNDYVPADGVDVAFDPWNANVAYAALANGQNATSASAGIYKSVNGGMTWTPVNSAPHSATLASIELALSAKSTAQGATPHIYALYGTTTGALYSNSVYVSTDGAATWTAHAATAEMAADEGWASSPVIAADPSDASGQTVLVGGETLWRSTDGANTWTDMGDPVWRLHSIAFDPYNSGSYTMAGEEGVTRCIPNYPGNCTNMTDGLNITETWLGSAGSIDSNSLNGQLYTITPFGNAQYPDSQGGVNAPTEWNQVDYAYGSTVVDFTDTSVVYDSGAPLGDPVSFANVGKSTNYGLTWYDASAGIDPADNTDGNLPLIMSQGNHNELLFGTNNLYRSRDGAQTWTKIASGSQPIEAVAVAASNDNYIYYADAAGDFYATTDGGASWIRSTTPSSPGSSISAIAVDPTHPLVVYVTVVVPNSGNGSGIIYKSLQGGAGNWFNIYSTAPLSSIAIDPAAPNIVVAAGYAGVIVSTDQDYTWNQQNGSTWSQLGSRLPNVAINSVFFNPTGSQIFLSTEGRGVWTLGMPVIQVQGGDHAPTRAVSVTSSPGTDPGDVSLFISNQGLGALNWTSNALPSWVTLSPTQGSLQPGQSQSLTLSFDLAGDTDTHLFQTSLTFSGAGAGNMVTLPIVVEQLMGAKQWYFAEGYTGGSFTEYLTLANATPSHANVQVQYFLNNGAPVTKIYIVNPNSRRTVNVNGEVGGGKEVSMVVTSDQPIVAERPMYFSYTGIPGRAIPGGHDVLGATNLSQHFDFAYVDTTALHDTYLTILNRNAGALNAVVNYYPANGGARIERVHSINANSRGTIKANVEGIPAGTYAITVDLSAPGLVERPMYFVDGASGVTGATDIIGVDVVNAGPTFQSWYFAEGYTSPTFSERYIVSNLDYIGASVTAQFLKSDGSTVTTTLTLAPHEQKFIDANAILGNGGVNNSAVVSSGEPRQILVERLMVFRYTGPVGASSSATIPGATDALGASAPGKVFYFAEGYTGGAFGEWLTLENPSATQTAQVVVKYLPDDGSLPTIETYYVAPLSRYTVLTNTVMVGRSFSMAVASDTPIVAERPMYFSYTGGLTGGTDVIGYQP